MNVERKPGIKEWAKIRARQKEISMRNFKFWYETNSGSIVMTEVLTEAEAIDWLSNNEQPITGLLFNEKMTSKEAYALIKQEATDNGFME